MGKSGQNFNTQHARVEVEVEVDVDIRLRVGLELSWAVGVRSALGCGYVGVGLRLRQGSCKSLVLVASIGGKQPTYRTKRHTRMSFNQGVLALESLALHPIGSGGRGVLGKG